MHYSQQIILKRWLPILKEYERTKAIEPGASKTFISRRSGHRLHIISRQFLYQFPFPIKSRTNDKLNIFIFRLPLKHFFYSIICSN